MITRTKILVFDHDDTTIEELALTKEQVINKSLYELSENKKTVIGISETVVNTTYTRRIEGGYRDWPYEARGTLVTILYIDET